MIDLAEMRRLRATGHNYVRLTLTRRRQPRERVRLLPGAYGRVVGPVGECLYLIDAPIEPLIRALEKHGGDLAAWPWVPAIPELPSRGTDT